MADLITRLKVDSQEYDSKLKRAADSLKAMEAEVRRTGASFAYADKAEVEYMKSLGNMATQSTSAKGQLRELTNAINDMAVMYRSLSDEEKSSQFGVAMSESMGALKERAAVLKDQMMDLDEELKHMASDTQFTDGINLMASTVGSCASAIVAWTGDSKEMEAVIKDLAKIQTTVKAVEALTKAFQKQNLVMLKNPYVAAAAAIAAVGVAMYEVMKNAQKMDAAAESVKNAMDKGREASAKEVTQISVLSDKLHDNSLSLEERKQALEAIQQLVPEYHGSLDAEGNLINDNTDAISAYVTELQRAATAQAAYDRLVELSRNKLNKQIERKQAVNAVQSAVAATVVTGGAGAMASTSVTGAAVAAAENRVADIDKEIAAIEREEEALKSLINTSDIAPTKTEKSGKTGTGTKAGAVAKEDPVAGSIDAQQLKVQELQKQWEAAASDESRATIKVQLDEANAELDRMMGKTQEVETVMEQTFQTGSLDDLKNKLSEATDYLNSLTVGTAEWEQALEGVLQAELAVNEAQAKMGKGGEAMNVVTADAKGTENAFNAAASAIGSVSGALEGMEDPGAKIAGIIGQAIATIALTFAGSMKGTFTPWDWIAAAAAGTATMVATIASIKSVTSGYAEGGLILPNGSPYQGDNIVARLNAGEGVLTAQGIENAGRLASQTNIAGGTIGLRTEISGENLAIVLDNNNRRRGRSKSVR